jgi:hypothetical protein
MLPSVILYAAARERNYYYKETLIHCPAAVYTADLAHGFGKNPRNTTSIPVFFACARRQSHRRIQRQAINQRSHKGKENFSEHPSRNSKQSLNLFKVIMRNRK